MYYLYHIKEIKWGCTNNLERRLKEQSYTIENLDRLILVGNINKANKMEKELNLEYGYKWNNSLEYKRVCSMASKGGYVTSKKYPNIIKITGSKNGKTNSIKSRYKLQKPVLQFDLNNNFIKEWPGVNLIKHEINICVSKCVRGLKNTAGGYIWKFK
jgi:hypothetical protein